ncbi:hypothetical protein Ocin01_17418 [Orchesella cincta]|uniref:Uncharacterized protein n=1 Tax=Orchesella cincta TaxID=48709 RepID=A0A1D2M8H5_ORCCI|nr:hypothetical protein Ocin01_17418 [Orchesella cincta]
MKDIGQAAELWFFSETQFANLRQLFESDKNYALFNGLSANIPSLLADEWEHLNIIQPLTDCIHRGYSQGQNELGASSVRQLNAVLTPSSSVKQLIIEQ